MQLVSAKLRAKGDRLNWTPLKDIKPVQLTACEIKGKVVHVNDTTKRNGQEKPKLLIP